jgi:hypothetical protein
VEFLYTRREEGDFGKSAPGNSLEEAMKRTIELTAEQEAEAQKLTVQITEAIADDVLRMARLLVSKDVRHTFGSTELQLRDIVHRIGAKVLETSLADKKTATTDQA